MPPTSAIGLPKGFETMQELIEATETFCGEALALAEKLRLAQREYSPAPVRALGVGGAAREGLLRQLTASGGLDVSNPPDLLASAHASNAAARAWPACVATHRRPGGALCHSPLPWPWQIVSS